MRRPLGIPAILEQRRRRAVDLVQRGERPGTVTRILGVDCSSIYCWRRAAVADGLAVSGDTADFETLDRDDSKRWLLIPAGQHVEREGCHHQVTSQRVIASSTWPGEGCELANFGLAIYPKTIDVDGRNSTPI